MTYTLEKLYEIVQRDNATLVDSYETLNRATTIKFICSCGINGKKRCEAIYKGNVGIKCSKCTRMKAQESIIKTNLERYGVENTFLNPDFIMKAKNTNIEKYGVEHAIQNPSIKAKVIATNIKKYGSPYVLLSEKFIQKSNETLMKNYGVNHPMKSDIIKERLRKTNVIRYNTPYSFLNDNVKSKCRDTIKKRYGVEYTIHNSSIRQKMIDTNIKKYGVPFVGSCDTIRKKTNDTMYIKYGVKYTFQAPSIKEKIKETNIVKYGVPYCLQNKEIRHKGEQKNLMQYGVKNVSQSPNIMSIKRRSAFSSKIYIFPSGKKIYTQGYENWALDVLLYDMGYGENDITLDNGIIPIFEYTLNNEDKIRKYFTDIYIIEEKKCIEVKSTWTYKKDYEKNYKKHECVQNSGHTIEFWIFTEKKTMTILKTLTDHINYNTKTT